MRFLIDRARHKKNNDEYHKCRHPCESNILLRFVSNVFLGRVNDLWSLFQHDVNFVNKIVQVKSF